MTPVPSDSPARDTLAAVPPLAPLLLLLAAPAPEPARGFVLAASLAVTHAIVVPIPSGELSLLLGGVLPRPQRRPGRWLALGYRGAFSGGFADLATTGDLYLFAHRHHLALTGVAGPHARLAWSASLGAAAFFAGAPGEGGDPPRGVFALEGEGRVGRVFGDFDPRRAQPLGGLQVRLSGVPGHAPWVTLGLFLGVQFGPHLPAPPPRERDLPPRAPPSPTTSPPRDFDADGFVDPRDRCPRDPGPAPHGCPEIDRDRDGSFAGLPCPACAASPP